MLFSPKKIGNVEISNRIVMAPMQQWKGDAAGLASDYHVNHYSARAAGGVGLIIVESTAVAANGRLFPNDIGLFNQNHASALKRVTDAVHAHGVPIFVQLCHGGRKASPEVTKQLLAPSAIAFDESSQQPRAVSTAEIEGMVHDFAMSARLAVEAGFDGIELHAAHGYLLHQFLSPLSNQRTDGYGGCLGNRVRFLKEVLYAVRREVGSDFVVQIRVSASDFVDGGLDAKEVGSALELLMPYGLDAVHVSSGGLLPIKPTGVAAGYQIGFAKTIKQHVPVPVIAVGIIYTKELANEVLENGDADFIAIGRPFLEDANYVQTLK